MESTVFPGRNSFSFSFLPHQSGFVLLLAVHRLDSFSLVLFLFLSFLFLFVLTFLLLLILWKWSHVFAALRVTATEMIYFRAFVFMFDS